MTIGRALDQFEAAFLESVRRRLVADVPVGAFLSGGLDSSPVVAAGRRPGRRLGESGQFPGAEHAIAQAARGAMGALRRGVARFVHDPQIRRDPRQRGQGVRVQRRIRDVQPGHVPDGLDHVFPLREWKLGRPPGDGAEGLVRPQQHVHLAQFRGFV